MTEQSVPRIFSRSRVKSRILRQNLRAAMPCAQQFIWQDICDDTAERIAFVKHEPKRRLVLGMCHDPLRAMLDHCNGDFSDGADWNIEEPFPQGGYDLIAVVGLLDAVNDLPGALIHIRNGLVPGGLAIASFVGGASLPRLRAAMLSADGDRPAARIHPMVDPRAVPQLLQRAGWKDPVVDTHTLTVRYSSLDQLVSDLRDHGLTGALSNAGPPLGKAALERARAAFGSQADADGKTAETFEIITLTGRRSLSGT
ncbi:methyltransferase domain-containing protein [Erythrobacter sanguineus]|jgi:SAM-dependent methyltransferase|uniref:Methyltransferase domain-containing protein n=1 Tax=Erythrobacter sanguineus TaxID=198312 RepID=A0A1M7S783_9SPHN|nr:methyltransferase domain-containing protein [Erythrobacter sanguineus]SHN54311.1 Methyltransferase domain-containing protein [Erythrobacter sanguineus]